MSRRLALVPAVLVALLAVSAGSASAADPGGDAFYRTAAGKLGGKVHGDLIRQRTLTGAAVVAGAAKTKLVLYRSKDLHGNDVPVSGVVSIPKGKAPKGGWPVITYAHGTTGIADQCAPSRDTAGSPVHPYNAYVYPLLTRWLRAGYAVVRTDYQGLGTQDDHQYLIGVTEGRSVLDMVRAARQADRRLSKDIIIAGHSQGGHAALFAAAVAPKYTPELHLKGTVAFAPVSHLDEQIPLATNLTQPNAGLTALVATIGEGLVAAYGGAGLAPDGFALADVLSNPAGIQLGVDAASKCLPDLAADATTLGLTPSAMFKPSVDFTQLRKLLDANDPSHLAIHTPLLIEQGSGDQTVLPLFTDQLATELTKASGSAKTVAYKKYPNVDHAGIVTAAAKDATAFIAQRLK